MLCSLLRRRRRFPSAVPSRAPSWLAAGSCAHLSVKITPHWIIQSHCGRNRKVYWPTTVGPTEKDAAADSLCAAASVLTLSLSLPSLLSLSLPDASHGLSALPNASAGAPARRLHRAAVRSDVLRSAQGVLALASFSLDSRHCLVGHVRWAVMTWRAGSSTRSTKPSGSAAACTPMAAGACSPSTASVPSIVTRLWAEAVATLAAAAATA